MNPLALRVLIAALAVGTLLLPAQTSPPAAPAPQATRRAARPAGSVTGSIKDGTGGVIPGAKVLLSNESGTVQTVTANADGNYTFRNVAPGTYTVSCTYPGLAQDGVTAITVDAGRTSTGNLTMTIQVQKQEVTVNDTTANAVSTDPANNATALVLRQEDLDALPDDPDDLEADLQALAGPGAGPGGNQIFIDGFTGGRLPPKESIREIRINSNPFSAEYDKVGFGRIQIFTKPGSDKFHGQGFYSVSDNIWNSRNPFSNVNPAFRSQNFGGNVSGPLTKHASFFVDVERRNIDDNSIIVASIPTQNFLTSEPYSQNNPNAYATPQRRTTVSPRLDYQLNANNTLSFRYSYLENDHLVSGVGGFGLPTTTIGGLTYNSVGYGLGTKEHSVQVVETSVLNAKTINESRFQFDRETSSWTSQSSSPTLSVGQAFTAGGSGYSAPGFGSAYDLQNGFEFQNYTSRTQGAHTMKFGIRIRTDILDNASPKGYNGSYQFLGGDFLDPNTNAPTHLTSIQQYLVTEQLLALGRTPQQINNSGGTPYGGPSKYLVSAGNPYIGFYQMDFGPFFQDDWKVRPNLTLSMGVRWESQTNIPSQSNWAPRFAFAWSPDNRGGNGRPKTVIRGGWGLFYDRFSSTNVQTVYRYTSAAQQSYQATRPIAYNAAFDTQIPISQLSLGSSTGQTYQIDKSLQPPRLMQTAFTLERQLLNRTSLNVSFTNTRGTHQLRTVDINAPLVTPGLAPPGAVNASAVGLPRPFGNVGDIYNYQSDGIYKQTQVSVGVNSQIGRWFTLFSRYSYTNANSNTDGLTTIPSNPYNLSAEWGQSALNLQHNLFVGGSVAAPWGLRFSPFLIAHSGQPFNITTGTDLYLQGTGAPTARPSLVSGATDLANPASYDLIPNVNAPIIPRNFGTGAGFIGLNLRVSKTWGFGTTKFSGPSGGARAGGGGGGGGGRRGGGGFGGGGGPRGGPGGGPGESTSHRYNLTASISARNIINHENLNTFNGSLTSPYFFQPTNITGGFGAEATASNQRRIDLQLRFSF